MSPKLMPLGARIIVKDESPTDDVSARAEAAGLIPVVYEHNRPMPTTGIVVAIGPDPEVQKQIHVGDRVFFGKNCGIFTILEGEQYRTLEYHELSSVVHMNECG